MKPRTTLFFALLVGVASCAKPAPQKSVAPASPAAAPETSGPLSGIGIRPLLHAGGFAIGQVFPGSNAERAGLEVGELVTDIDGESSAHLTLQEVAARLRGRPGTSVILTVDRAPPVQLTIARAVLKVPELPR